MPAWGSGRKSGGRTEVELTTQANGLPTEAVFADKASANDKLKHDESLAHLPNRWDLIRPEIATISSVASLAKARCET